MVRRQAGLDAELGAQLAHPEADHTVAMATRDQHEPGAADEKADVPIEDAHRPKVSRFPVLDASKRSRYGPDVAASGSCDRQGAPMRSVVVALGLAVALALANYWALWPARRSTLVRAVRGDPARRPVRARAGARRHPAGASAAPAAPTPVAREAGARAAKPSEPPEHTALRLLASLQEDGRLVDFLTEEIAGYSDEQIGAATRGIHDGCAKALRALRHARAGAVGHARTTTVTVPAGFDPRAHPAHRQRARRAAVHGHAAPRAAGAPTGVTLPARSGLDPTIIAPAEVEIA